MAEAFAAPIIQTVLDDEAEHLDDGQRWLAACCERADLTAIGIDPAELVGEFVGCFQEAIERVGFESRQARGLVARLAGQAADVAL